MLPALQPNPRYLTHTNTDATRPWHPYRLTQGPGGGAVPPFGSPVVFVNVGSRSTLLAHSPHPRQCRLQYCYYWQDSKITFTHRPNPELQRLPGMLLCQLTKTILDNKRKSEKFN